MKINCFLCPVIFLIIWGCTKTEIRQMEFKGNLNVSVSTNDEFGRSINDGSDFKVTLEGLNPTLEINTNENGVAEFKEIPFGTYRLTIQKEGYGSIRYSNLKILGGEKAESGNFVFFKKSTTKIKNFKIDFSSFNSVISGTISHNYPKTLPGYYSTYPFGLPLLAIFISNKTDVSPTNYIYKTSCFANQQNDTTFSANLYLSSSQFPSGTQLYAVMCGFNRNSVLYYDAETYSYQTLGIGDLSEVKSFLIP